MLELSGQLHQRAAGLAADAKQKISLGRGLVREDVSAVLFDEPLTVIDPHLKWQLRRKLKQIHQELKLTLIYVTHDQVEALTFAEQVVVMTRGRAVQIGSASELFDRPQHTFVGHFIGSPGMNFLPAEAGGRRPSGRRPPGRRRAGRAARPRPADARRAPRVRDAGAGRGRGRGPRHRHPGPGHRHLLAGDGADRRRRRERGARPPRARTGRCRRRATRSGFASSARAPASTAPTRTSWSRERRHEAGEPEGVAPDPAGDRLRRLLGDPAADDGRQLLGAGHHLARAARLRRHRVVQVGDARRRPAGRAAAPDRLLGLGAAGRDPARHRCWRCRCRPRAGRRRRCWCWWRSRC